MEKDINGKEVKLHDIIRLYSSYYFVVEDDEKLYAIQLSRPIHIQSLKMLDGEFEVIKDINSIIE